MHVSESSKEWAGGVRSPPHSTFGTPAWGSYRMLTQQFNYLNALIYIYLSASCIFLFHQPGQTVKRKLHLFTQKKRFFFFFQKNSVKDELGGRHCSKRSRYSMNKKQNSCFPKAYSLLKKSNKENISVSSFREREKLECQRVLSAQQKNKAKNMNEIQNASSGEKETEHQFFFICKP